MDVALPTRKKDVALPTREKDEVQPTRGKDAALPTRTCTANTASAFTYPRTKITRSLNPTVN